MRITCEGCGHAHELNPETIPLYGARVRCAGCGRLIHVPPGGTGAAPAPDRIEPASANSPTDYEVAPDVPEEVETAPDPDDEPGLAHGVDPDLDAMRLARGLLTDVVYADPERFESARRSGRVLAEYVDEIDRAYASYRRRLGAETPLSAGHFRRALREILGAPPRVNDHSGV